MTVWVDYALGPVVGATIGWITNWVAVRMLFRPRREVRILGVPFHGLIPKRRAALTLRAGEIIEEELISRDDLRRVIESAELEPPILKIVEERVDQFLADQLQSLPGLVRRMVPREVVRKIKANFMEEMQRVLPRMTDDVIRAINDRVDFKQLVVEKLEAVEIEEFERLVNRLARRELRSIELVGALLGFLIGALQSLWLWLAR